MSLPPLVSEAAEADLCAAYSWYESQRIGLGQRLLSYVREALDSISENPTGFPKVHHETRRALVHRFPYAIYFLIEPTFVDILAVMHTRQHPRRWRSRAR